MTLQSPDLQSTEIKLALAAAAYRSDTVRLVDMSLDGITHLLASRQGLYAVHETGCRLLAHGLFFGLTLRGDDLFLFEACDLPRSPTHQGRIVRLCMRDHRIIDAQVVCKGLDNGCHQIDFLDGRLVVLDTYHQQVLRFAEGESSYQALHPLPVCATAGDPEYRHVNSLLAVGERILLLLHNGALRTGRPSEIAVFDRSWQELERWQLDGSGCHGLALLENGAVLTCGSMEGNLISTAGLRLHVSPHLTRGLAVGADSVVVGASELVEREGRLRNAGTVTFMDRAYNVRAVLDVPGAPTEIRRLDGQDSGLSSYLAAQSWGSTLKRG